jgi:hypothetical protein
VKKAALGVLLLVLSCALGWGVYKWFGSEKAGYIVAVVTMAAAIIPIFFHEPPPQSRSTTYNTTTGNQSPAEVHGDFIVTQTTTPPRKK